MNQSAQTTSERLLRLPDVEALTGLKKTAIYAGIKAGTFPPCIKLSQRAAAWPQSVIQVWIAERIKASRGGK